MVFGIIISSIIGGTISKFLTKSDYIIVGGDKRDFFFPNISYNIRKQIKTDDESMWSITRQQDADIITNILYKYGSTITDITSCVGGNVISFAEKFDHINAIEIDEMRYNYLVHNIKLLNLQDKVTCYHEDSLQIIDTLSQDIIFCDAPWTGYSESNSLMLYIDNIPIYTVCHNLSNKCKVIALKLPINFDYSTFFDNCKFDILDHIKTLRKMHLLVLKTSYKFE